MDLVVRIRQGPWTYLILAEQRIANTSQNHHSHQKRGYQFVHHPWRGKQQRVDR